MISNQREILGSKTIKFSMVYTASRKEVRLAGHIGNNFIRLWGFDMNIMVIIVISFNSCDVCGSFTMLTCDVETGCYWSKEAEYNCPSSHH